VTRNRSPRKIDDSGASLLIVLAFVTGVMVIMSSLLAYSGTSLGGTKSTKYRNDLSYDVDGALKAGITQIRNSQFQNHDPATCGNYLTAPDGTGSVTAMNFPASNQDGRKVVVTCAGGPSTGLDAENVPITASNRPGQAVLVLANSGTGFDNGRNGNLSVKGKMRGNSTISSSSGSITVLTGEVKAPSCSGTITVQAGTKDCAAPANWTDPNYAVDSGPMTHRSVPACNTTTTAFEPGYYDDAEALSTRINNCNARLFWFRPGVYYFDFRNAAPSASTYLSGNSTSTEWSINNQNALIIAGTPTFSTTNPPSNPASAIPAGCVSPLNSIGNNQGVTFVFGGSSRLNLTRGYMEICGQYFKSKLPIAVHGATTATAADPHATATVTTPDTTHTNTTGDLPFNNPNGAITAADSTNATVLPSPTPSPVPSTAATARIPDNRTASATFPGFVQAIPKHSTLTKADLVVVHRENRQGGTKAPQSIQVTLTPSPTGSPLAAANVPANYINNATGGAFRSDTVDLLPTLASRIYADGLTSLTAKYAVRTENSGGALDSYLDQIRLELEWDPPTLRPIGTTDSTYRDNGQPILYTSNLNNNRGLYVQGTTYVPNSRLDLTLNNASAQVFRSGIVAWRAAVEINPSTTYSDPVIEVPDQTLDYSDVYFTAWVCGSGSAPTTAATASSTCQRAGTARASFQDDDPASVSTTGSRKVKVYSWTIYR
jgi:hypothetical protein